MKSTGIIRRVDELGRIVIPIELRRSLDIEQKDAVEIFVDNDQIILKKHTPDMSCFVTGKVSADNIQLLNGELVLNPEVVQQILTELKDIT